MGLRNAGNLASSTADAAKAASNAADAAKAASNAADAAKAASNAADAAKAAKAAGAADAAAGAARSSRLGRLSEMGSSAFDTVKKGAKKAAKNPKTTLGLMAAGGYVGVYIKNDIDRKKKREECNTLCTSYNKETDIFSKDGTAELQAFNDEELKFAKWEPKYKEIFGDSEKYDTVRCFSKDDRPTNRSDDPHFVEIEYENGKYIVETCSDHCENICKEIFPKPNFFDPTSVLGFNPFDSIGNGLEWVLNILKVLLLIFLLYYIIKFLFFAKIGHTNKVLLTNVSKVKNN
jgi:hypothetical protein